MELYAQVCTNGSLVLIAESLVHILVHKRCLSDTIKVKEATSVRILAVKWHDVPAIAQNNDL